MSDTTPEYEAKPHPDKPEHYIVINDDERIVEEFPPPDAKEDAEEYAEVLNEIAKSDEWEKEDAE